MGCNFNETPRMYRFPVPSFRRCAVQLLSLLFHGYMVFEVHRICGVQINWLVLIDFFAKRVQRVLRFKKCEPIKAYMCQCASRRVSKSC